MSGLSLCLLAALGVSRGADRLTNIAALPVVDPGARIGYVGSIDPTGGNADWNWGDRQDKNGEWILFEDTGAGCIYNFTQHRTKTYKGTAYPVPTYRFYFDGATTPQFELTPEEFGTKAPFLSPLAGSFSPDHQTLDFHIVRSFVPMAYRKSARVTSTVQLKGGATDGGGWGHVTYHHYDSPECLTTFDGTDDGKALQAEYSAQHQLAHDGVTDVASFSLAGGARREVFAANGRSTLVLTQLKVGGFASATNLAKDLWIVCSFDGKTTVEAPVGTFFGCEMPAHAAQRRLALLTFDTKSEAGTAILENRFPMPFFSSAKIVLENRGTAALTVAGSVRTNGRLEYDPKTTGLFTASDYCPPTRNVAGKNARIGELVGRGQMAYGTISLRNATVRGCEGDVRCYIDDVTPPRVQSDGSESWGSWGWGFSKPPQTQPFAAYDSPATDNTSWSQVRLLIGDSYPFQMRLRFEIEHGDCNDLAGSESSGQVFGYVISPVASSLTLTSPGNYASVATLNAAVKAFNALPADTKAGMMAGDADNGDADRAALRKAYKEDLPVVSLAWTGTTGTCLVKVYRERDNKLVFDGKSSDGTAAFWDPEIGRNYRWTVTCGENVAEGFFHTESEGPRLINEKYGKVRNARDFGGWTTVDGKVVRQGILFRSASVDEFEGVGNAYCTGTLGVRFDLDLRSKQELNDDGIARFGGDIRVSPLGAGVVRWNSEDRLGDGVAFMDTYSNIFNPNSTTWKHQKAFWNDFMQLNTDANLPAVFHCSAGRDRTGCLAYVMGAVLGVGEADLATDFYTSWASQGYPHDYSRTNKWLPQFVSDLKSKYAGATLKEKAEAVLIQCCRTAGGTEAEARAEIEKFRTRMLETRENPHLAPGEEPEKWDWLQTDSKGYIRTGYVPKLRWTKIETKVQFLEFSGNCAVYSANAIQNLTAPRNAYGNLLLLESNDGGTKFDYNNLAKDLPDAQQRKPGCKPTFNSDMTRPHVFVTYNNKIWIDGAVTEGADDANDVEAGSDLLLFTTSYTKDSRGRDRSYLNQSRKKVYYLRVWEMDANGGERLVHSYRPAKDGNGAATLYDEVAGVCLPVVNGGGFTVGNDVDATQVSIDEGLSGDAVAIPSGAAVSLSGGSLVVNGRAYAPKAHYVFKEKGIEYALDIAQEEAVVAGFEIAADGTVSVTSDKAFGNFWYALEHADTPFFGLSSQTAWQKLTADSKTLSAPQQGDRRFYRLLVTDRPE